MNNGITGEEVTPLGRRGKGLKKGVQITQTTRVLQTRTKEVFVFGKGNRFLAHLSGVLKSSYCGAFKKRVKVFGPQQTNFLLLITVFSPSSFRFRTGTPKRRKQ
jgi:hypothetical protein